MICQHCSQMVSDDAKFCSHCGSALYPQEQPQETSTHSVFSDFAQRIHKIAGIESPVELRLRDVFSRVFARHTEGEAESLFIVGTKMTTPNLLNVTDTWPKPWLFARVFLFVALAYFGLYLGLSAFQNPLFLPGLIMMGAFMVPLTLLIFFWEMNAPQNISLYAIIKMVLFGGVLSLVVSMVFYEVVGNAGDTVAIGMVEEAAKVVAILWLLKGKKYNFVLNGLLIGAAVGTGFATLETAGYALDIALNTSLQSMYSVIFWRGCLAPGGHIVWAALSGAALCMVKGGREFNWAMLRDIRFVRMFVIVVLLHAAWDTVLPIDNSVPVLQIALTIISWIIAFAVMGTGLKEITQEKERANQVTGEGGSTITVS